MPATGPDFISLQVTDLAASQAFYERYLGLVRSPAGPPHAVVFTTTPIAFAIRPFMQKKKGRWQRQQRVFTLPGGCLQRSVTKGYA